jgi:hypothetical protein
MKTRSMICSSFLIALLATLLPPVVAAPQVSATAQSVTCESNDGNRQYCGNYDPRQVKMQRQISQSVCAYNQSWGVDRRGLWVDRGCRAIFSISRGPGGPGPGGPGPGGPGWVHPGPGNPWPPSGGWNGGNWGRGGACFYTSANFGGDYFCMRRGESRSQLGGYGDQISSIRVFGGARVTVFNDRNYRNGHDTTVRDVADLRSWRMSSRPSNTWNNRISSLQVK